jgi:hypothetical protein
MSARRPNDLHSTIHTSTTKRGARQKLTDYRESLLRQRRANEQELRDAASTGSLVKGTPTPTLIHDL